MKYHCFSYFPQAFKGEKAVDQCLNFLAYLESVGELHNEKILGDLIEKGSMGFAIAVPISDVERFTNCMKHLKHVNSHPEIGMSGRHDIFDGIHVSKK